MTSFATRLRQAGLYGITDEEKRTTELQNNSALPTFVMGSMLVLSAVELRTNGRPITFLDNTETLTESVTDKATGLTDQPHLDD